MKFSVIVPVYNVAPYLPACLDSLLAAGRGFDVELVCVDDGSTDCSGALLDGYVRNHANVRCLHQGNGGCGAARDAGLQAAGGDWILFIDADDVVRESMFRDVARMAAEHPSADIVSFRVTSFEGPRPVWADGPPSPEVVDLGTELPDGLAGRPLCSMACRRAIVSSLRFSPFPLGEDLVFACEVLVRARQCVLIDTVEYAYRRRPGSAIQSAWTTERMVAAISFCPVMFGVLDRSGKRIGEAFVRGRGDEWLFRLPLAIYGLRRVVDGRRAWAIWFKSVEEVRHLRLMTRSHRLVASLAKWRNRWLVLLACRVALKVRRWQRRRSAG